jgi:hypothetical protein
MDIPRISVRQICDGWIVERGSIERGPYASGEFAARIAHADAADVLRSCAELEFVVLRIGGDVESAHRMTSSNNLVALDLRAGVSQDGSIGRSR